MKRSAIFMIAACAAFMLVAAKAHAQSSVDVATTDGAFASLSPIYSTGPRIIHVPENYNRRDVPRQQPHRATRVSPAPAPKRITPPPKRLMPVATPHEQPVATPPRDNALTPIYPTPRFRAADQFSPQSPARHSAQGVPPPPPGYTPPRALPHNAGATDDNGRDTVPPK